MEGPGREARKATEVSRVVKEPAELKKGDHWLSSNLIVKMADRTYKKGRHYNTKVFNNAVHVVTCVVHPPL